VNVELESCGENWRCGPRVAAAAPHAALSLNLFWGRTRKFKKFIFATIYELRVNVVHFRIWRAYDFS
jgi:hypothetical protein